MNTLGNLVWLILGGFIVFVEYLIAGVILCITIVGIPFGIQVFKLSTIALWPFNKNITSEKKATSLLATFMNLIWLIFGGIWIAITHLIFALLLAITIIGIPWAKQHYKLAQLSLIPFSLKVTNK